jgi:hypothetical protein
MSHAITIGDLLFGAFLGLMLFTVVIIGMAMYAAYGGK